MSKAKASLLGGSRLEEAIPGLFAGYVETSLCSLLFRFRVAIHLIHLVAALTCRYGGAIMNDILLVIQSQVRLSSLSRVKRVT